MIKIAICDDVESMQTNLEEQITQYFSLKGLGVEIKLFSSGSKLLVALEKERFDFFFLDILLGNDINGIDLGQLIKQIYPQAVIVFVTGFEEHMPSAFNLHAFQYLLKPVKEGAIPKLFDDYFAETQKEKHKYLTIKHNYQEKLIRYDSIIYITKERNRSIIITTDKGELRDYSPLKIILPQLDGRFAQCHSGFIVNIDKITEYNKKFCKMCDGTKINISKTYKDTFKDLYYDYRKGEMIG